MNDQLENYREKEERKPLEDDCNSEKLLSTKAEEDSTFVEGLVARKLRLLWSHVPKTWRCWQQEMFLYSVMVVDLAALFLTIAANNGAPQKTWALGIKINGVVSIFTTVMKAAGGSVLANCA